MLAVPKLKDKSSSEKLEKNDSYLEGYFYKKENYYFRSNQETLRDKKA